MFLKVFSETQLLPPHPTYKVGAYDEHHVPECTNKSMDVNPEMVLLWAVLWHMNTAQCREHCVHRVHVAQSLLSQRCEVRVFISSESLEANNKPYQGCCVA